MKRIPGHNSPHLIPPHDKVAGLDVWHHIIEGRRCEVSVFPAVEGSAFIKMMDVFEDHINIVKEMCNVYDKRILKHLLSPNIYGFTYAEETVWSIQCIVDYERSAS